jgi:hypothetical protein
MALASGLSGPASRRPLGSEGQRGEPRAGYKWLIGSLLANFPAPIPATPRISLHESRAPKRVTLPGDRQPGPVGRPKAGWGRAARPGSKWLIGSLLANFPAPIHATPRISLHESCAPKREPLMGARRADQGQRGKPRVGSKMADRLFARQCCCSDPCNATHQPSRIPRPQASGYAGEPPAGNRRAAKARGASRALAPNG